MNTVKSEHQRIAGNAVAMLQRTQISGAEAILYIEVMNWLDQAITAMEERDGGCTASGDDDRQAGPP